MFAICACGAAGDSHCYCISQEHVKTELKRLLYVDTAVPTTCLNQMRLVDDFLSDPALPAGPHNRQYALSSILTRMIRCQYLEQRLLFQCQHKEPVSHKDALFAIWDDAQIGSHELRGWSYLYYIYVRVDLGVSHALYAQAACSSDRHVRRWHQHALGRLTMKLIEAEHEALRAWQRRVVAEPGLLPSAHPRPRLPSRSEEE